MAPLRNLRKRGLPRPSDETQDVIRLPHGSDGSSYEHRCMSEKSSKRLTSKQANRPSSSFKREERRRMRPFLPHSLQHCLANLPFLGSISNQTWQATVLLVAAIFISLHVNQYALVGVPALLQSLCAQPSVRCHASLGVSTEHNRTVLAQHGSIAANQVVLQIPNEFTIWDVDALRDPWIYHHILLKQQQGTRNNGTLSSAAYLAVYLARLLFHDRHASKTHTVRLLYLSILSQTLQEFQHHPVVWSEAEIETWLGSYTSTYNHVMDIKYQIQTEYELLRQIAPVEFSPHHITWEQYQIGRLNVLTRSFGTGRLDHSVHFNVTNHPPITKEEILYYQSTLGIDLSNGCHVMVPILDQLNHHGQQHNVGFLYDASLESFVVTALRTIVTGTDVMDNYGKRTHADLFAKYGFIQSSDPTGDYSEATIALWHHHFDHRIFSESRKVSASVEQQYSRQMLRYLQYDDGYDHCVVDPTAVSHHDSSSKNDMEQAWVLKQLKYQHLLHIFGKQSQRWVIRMPPGTHDARPGNPPKVENWHNVLSTCRLIVLTHYDFNFTAIEMLQSNVYNSSFYLLPEMKATSSALEFRTYMCMARIIQTAMSRFPVSTIQNQMKFLASMNPWVDDTLPSRNWTVAQLHLQELRTLDTAKQLVFHYLRQQYPHIMRPDIVSSLPYYSMRDEPCSFQYLEPLLRQSTHHLPNAAS